MGLLLVVFSVGIGAGSLACAKLARGRIEPGWIFLGCVGLTLFGGDIYAVTATMQPVHLTVDASLTGTPGFTRLLVDLGLLGLSGGLYVVPLYAYVQHRSDASRRSRIIAANNIFNALFMVVGSVLAIMLRKLGLGVGAVLLAAALVNVVVVACLTAVVRRGLLRFFVSGLIHVFYRVAKRDLDRVPTDTPALIVCNHPSVIDAPIIAAACTRPVRFVMYHRIYNARGFRWFFEAVEAIPIAPRHEDERCMQAAFDEIERALRAGEIVCIFPEGKVTKDGELNEFRRGVEEVLARTPVPVVPMALRGLWGSTFSRSGAGVLRKRPRGFGSPVEVLCGEPVPAADANAELLQERVAELRGDVR
jgi:1-acyl-sn-glycerol-3-phosphate acyltransferase